MISFTKLGDACLVKRGTTITRKQTKKGNVPVIAGGRKATYFHNQHNRKSGTITISGSGASAGLVNYWQIPIFASDCSTVELKDNKQNIKFVYYYMQSMQELIYKEMRYGAAQPHVYAKDIANLNFPIISLKEQERIVAKLDAAFIEIEKYNENISKTKNYFKDLLNKFLINLINKKEYKWKETTFPEICINLDNKRIPIKKSKRIEGKIPYYGASGIVDYVKDWIFDDNLLLVSEDGANLLMRTYPIAFNVNGKCWVNNHAHVLKFKDKKLQYWVENYLNSTDLSQYISGMAQPKLNQTKLNTIKIPVPAENLLEDLIIKIKSFKENFKIYQSQIDKKLSLIETLKLSILKQKLNISK